MAWKDQGNARKALAEFVEAYRQGRIYRGPRMIQWDPASQTALSDLEVENVDTDGHLWHIAYPVVGGGGDPGRAEFLHLSAGPSAAVGLHPYGRLGRVAQPARPADPGRSPS